MKAMVLDRPGPVETAPLRLVEVPIPEPGPGEILIRVEVCGGAVSGYHITTAIRTGTGAVQLLEAAAQYQTAPAIGRRSEKRSSERAATWKRLPQR